MDVNSLDQLRAALEAAARQRAGDARGAAVSDVAGAQFSDALKNALQKVSDQQTQSQQLQRGFASGDPAVSLEQTMVAMQKSQVSFQAALTVRNRLLSAYTEIMNMQV